MWWFLRVSQGGGGGRIVEAVGYLRVDRQDCVEDDALWAVVDFASRLFRAAYRRRK